MLYCTEYSQCSQAVPYYTSIGKKYGDDVVYSAAASQSAPNYLAQCLAAKAAGANSLFPATSSDVAVRVVENCAKQGYTPHLLAGSGSYQKSFAGTPGTNGMIATDHNVPFFDTSNPQIKTMTAAFNKYDPSLTKSPYYDDTAVWNWINGVLMVQAAKAAHWTSSTPVTAASLKSALLGLRHDDRRRPDGPRDVRHGEARGQQLRLHGLHQEQQVHPPVRAEGHLPPVELSISGLSKGGRLTAKAGDVRDSMPGRTAAGHADLRARI